MKLTILGAGVGGFQYLPGKDNNRYPPAFLVEWGDEKILFECSAAVDQRLEDVGCDYSSIHHLAVSHPHSDHYVPIAFLLSIFLKGLLGGEKFINKTLNIYGPDFIIDNFATLFHLHFPNLTGNSFDWPKLQLVSTSKKDCIIQIGNGELSAQKVYHGGGKCDAVSYRLKLPEGVLVYSGDTGDCEGIREIVKDADIFICEASAKIGDFQSPKTYGHLNPYTIGEIAKNRNVKKIILFHYSGLDSDDAMIADVKKAGFQGEVIAGKDFQIHQF